MLNFLRRLSEAAQFIGGQRNALLLAVKNPGKAFASARAMFGADRELAALVGGREALRQYERELLDSDCLAQMSAALQQSLGDVEDSKFLKRAGIMRESHLRLLYALIRGRQPQLVIETGVCNGASSRVMLEALSRNTRPGRLLSVDLPDIEGQPRAEEMWEGKGLAQVPKGHTTGWLVPERLGSYWDLRLGRSDRVLAQLASGDRKPDFFIHDSEHSYSNQKFEFDWANSHLRSSGVLIASDISWSHAYRDFLLENKRHFRNISIDHNLALAVREQT